ncbi:MAG: LysR family transcriptional regulator [Candidimonas sp.]|nr:MAG: LysR family transcriptional regulator [Candidimonas sp.]TAM26521.1 MAG: LysR family transcriptional regulator [Candidimonas sp.]
MIEALPSTPLFIKKRHVELLLALHETQHLGRTADRLHMSQPAASKALAQLEEQIGVSLFLRTPYGTKPTPLGMLLIAYAKNLTGSAQRIGDEIHALLTLNKRMLRIGVLPSSSVHTLPKLISRLIEYDAGLDITIFEGTLHVLVEKLEREELDLVIGRVYDALHRNWIDELFLYDEPVAIVCGAQSKLARRTPKSLQDLIPYRWIVPIGGTVQRDCVEEMFDRARVRPSDVIESNALLTNISLINQYDWVSVLPQSLARYYEAKKLVKTMSIKSGGNFGAISLLYRKQVVVPSQIQLAVQIIHDLFPATCQ